MHCQFPPGKLKEPIIRYNWNDGLNLDQRKCRAMAHATIMTQIVTHQASVIQPINHIFVVKCPSYDNETAHFPLVKWWLKDIV